MFFLRFFFSHVSPSFILVSCAIFRVFVCGRADGSSLKFLGFFVGSRSFSRSLYTIAFRPPPHLSFFTRRPGCVLSRYTAIYLPFTSDVYISLPWSTSGHLLYLSLCTPGLIFYAVKVTQRSVRTGGNFGPASSARVSVRMKKK
eukprot:RCo019189